MSAHHRASGLAPQGRLDDRAVQSVRDLLRERHADVVEAGGLESLLVLALGERAADAADPAPPRISAAERRALRKFHGLPEFAQAPALPDAGRSSLTLSSRSSRPRRRVATLPVRAYARVDIEAAAGEVTHDRSRNLPTRYRDRRA